MKRHKSLWGAGAVLAACLGGIAAAVASAPLRRTPRMVVPCGSKESRSFMATPQLDVAPAGSTSRSSREGVWRLART